MQRRHLALPMEEYAALAGFGAANDVFIDVGTRLGAEAVGSALAAVGLDPSDVDVLMSTTVTGVAAPTLDARLVPVLGLRPDVRRVPLFGLGCVAGAAGVARLHDLVAGDPDAVAVLLSVELCSLTVQRDDTSMANLVASGLFGDGAAAVVLVGDRRAARLGIDGPTVVATRSRLYPDTERVMGWDIGGSGFRIVLAASVADVVEEHLGQDVTAFLGDHDLKVDDVETWVAHPGGPKVLHAMSRTLGLADPERWTAPGARWSRSATCRRPRCCTCSPPPWPSRHRPPAARPSCSRWARASAPSWCCSDGEQRVALPAPGARGRGRAARRAGRQLAAHPGRQGRPAEWSAGSGTTRRWSRCTPACSSGPSSRCGRRPAVPAVAGLADAGPGAGQPGAALVVHRDPGPSLEHPGGRRPGRAAGELGPYRSCGTPTTSPSSSRASRCRSCTRPG